MSSYTIHCSACGTDNRVPAEMAGKTGRCGNCRTKLTPLYFQPQQMTEKSFDSFISCYPGPVLAEFWAPW